MQNGMVIEIDLINSTLHNVTIKCTDNKQTVFIYTNNSKYYFKYMYVRVRRYTVDRFYYAI